MTPATRRRLRRAVEAAGPALAPAVVDGRTVYPACFVELGYPPEDASRHRNDPRLHKEHLRYWWACVKRAYPGSWAFWTLSYRRNGNPRFHLIVSWGGARDNWLNRFDWTSMSWTETTAADRRGDGDKSVKARTRRTGTRFALPVTADKLAAYVSEAGGGRCLPPTGGSAAETPNKKARTRPTDDAVQGRWWGTLNKKGFQAAAGTAADAAARGERDE